MGSCSPNFDKFSGYIYIYRNIGSLSLKQKKSIFELASKRNSEKQIIIFNMFLSKIKIFLKTAFFSVIPWFPTKKSKNLLWKHLPLKIELLFSRNSYSVSCVLCGFLYLILTRHKFTVYDDIDHTSNASFFVGL